MSAGATRDFLALIRFEHTLFALPYAIAGAFLAAQGWPPLTPFLWILVAMVAARTAAMTFNRFVDRRFDATNPRTAQRESVTGKVSPTFMVGALGASIALFFLAAWMLRVEGHRPWAFILAAPTLVILLGYSLTKRFFSGTHFVLGLALGLSPLGAWVAIRGDLVGIEPALWLGVSVLFWTAGFDILYAIQDVDHDRKEGLYSVPALLGRQRAFWAARFAHLFVPLALYLAGRSADLGPCFLAALLLVIVLLVVEHWLLRGGQMERIAQAFFHINVAIAFIVMFGIAIDILFDLKAFAS